MNAARLNVGLEGVAVAEAAYQKALAYARENGVNRVEGGREASLGIVCAGKSYLDVRQALADLGLRDEVRILKLGMIWPLERDIVRAFAEGLREVIVIEEKRPFVEPQVRDALYDLPDRPAVVGKRDERGRDLVPGDRELTPDRIASVLAARLGDHMAAAAARSRIAVVESAAASEPLAVSRGPYFCSGCPHNRSIVVPEGSIAGGGIGCHTMAAYFDDGPVIVTQILCASEETAMPLSSPGPTSEPSGSAILRTATIVPSCLIRTMVPLPRLAT